MFFMIFLLMMIGGQECGRVLTFQILGVYTTVSLTQIFDVLSRKSTLVCSALELRGLQDQNYLDITLAHH